VNCQVSNQTLRNVGITSYKVGTIAGNPSLAWTVGVANYDHINSSNSNQRNIERTFYLGTPPSLDLTASDLPFAGCAFYLTRANNENIFYDSNTASSSSQTQCQDNLGIDCVLSLISLLSELSKASTANNSVAETCSSIASSMRSQPPSQCDRLISLNASITGTPLTGSSAPVPLNPQENSTSNCYPTLPKTNELTRIFSYNISATLDLGTTAPPLLGETPVMSLFYSTAAGNATSTQEPDVHFSCLKIVDSNDASEATKNNGSSGHDESDALGRDRALGGIVFSICIATIVMASFTIY
jgi:hypothetical protein